MEKDTQELIQHLKGEVGGSTGDLIDDLVDILTKEKRVYVINCAEDFDFRGAEYKADYEGIMSKAEELGSVYSLKGFQEKINDEELNLSNSFIYIS